MASSLAPTDPVRAIRVVVDERALGETEVIVVSVFGSEEEPGEFAA